MTRRREFISPGVVIGLVATLLAYDARCAGSQSEQWVAAFWAIGLFAPLIGCAWVRQKSRADGRGLARSLGVTLAMGAMSGLCVGTCMFPIIGTTYGLVLGTIYTAAFITPPTLWIAAISLAGFRRSREGSFARTIWWRRRWHATVGMCASAIVVRLWLAPATPYVVGLSLGIAVIAGLCLLSLLSLARELVAATADVTSVAPESAAALPCTDLGVGDAIYMATTRAGDGPYRSGELSLARLVGDVGVVQAMMRHTLWGAVVLVGFATSTLAAATLSLLHAR